MVRLGLVDRLSVAPSALDRDTLQVVGRDAGPIADNLVLRSIAAARVARSYNVEFLTPVWDFGSREARREKLRELGFDIDYLPAVAKEAGFAVTFKNTAWDGIFAGLAAGRYDMIASSVTITDERKKQNDFSDPYINVGQILVVPKT